MEAILYLYPDVLTFVVIITGFVSFFWGFYIWRRRSKARGTHSNEVEVYRVIAIGIPAVFLFFSSDITMYQLGADLSIERLRSSFSAFFLAITWGIYFGFVVPKIFRFDYNRLPFNEYSLRSLPKGLLLLGFAFLTAKVSHALASFVFDTYAPCVLGF